MKFFASCLAFIQATKTTPHDNNELYTVAFTVDVDTDGPPTGDIEIDGGSGGSEICNTLYMYDSYGDGWNGNYFNIGGQSFTATGYGSNADVCLAEGCYDVSVDGGSWQGEVSWEFAGASGGAPYSGEICVDASGSTVSSSGPVCSDPWVDSYGDGCDWYVSNPSGCGYYDTDCGSAWDECDAC